MSFVRDRFAGNGVAIAFLSYLFFALSDASIKLLEGRVPPFELTFFGAILGLSAVPFIREAGDGIAGLWQTSHRQAWLIRAAASATCTVCSVIAFTHLSMPEAFSLIFLMPLFVTVLSALLLKEQVGPWRWAAVVMGFVGVLIVLRPGLRSLSPAHFAAMAAGLSGALSVVMYRAAGPGERKITLYGAGVLGPLVINGVLMLPTFALPSPMELLFIAAYGLLAAMAQVLLMLASRASPASVVAPVQYSQMLWAVLLSYAVFDQGVDHVAIFGITVIIGSGVLTRAREKLRMPAWRRWMPLRPR